MKVIPKRTFLLRQDVIDGKTSDVIAHKGVAIEVTDKEAAAFYGYLIFGDNEKKTDGGGESPQQSVEAHRVEVEKVHRVGIKKVHTRSAPKKVVKKAAPKKGRKK